MALGKLSKTGKRKQDEKHSATVSVELEAPSSKSKHLRVSKHSLHLVLPRTSTRHDDRQIKMNMPKKSTKNSLLISAPQAK